MSSKAASVVRDDAPRMPGVEGVWVFVGADLMFFTVLFAAFLLARRDAVVPFEAGRRTLDADIGGFNTLLLLTSSWFVARAVEAAQRGQHARVPRWLGACAACGLLFAISKGVEYGAKLAQGITPLSSDFHMYYFVLTGFHLLHVLAGTVLLVAFWTMARRRAFDGGRFVLLECSAIVWHMIDLLWILLFPLLYLLH